MIKRARLILFLLAFLFTDVAPAQQTVRVVILPFTINAQEDLSYLEKEIPQAIKNQLEQEGAKVLVIDKESLESRNVQADNLKDIRELALQTGTDYIIWGFNDTAHNYSSVSYSGDILACERCHAGTASDPGGHVYIPGAF